MAGDTVPGAQQRSAVDLPPLRQKAAPEARRGGVSTGLGNPKGSRRLWQGSLKHGRWATMFMPISACSGLVVEIQPLNC